MLRKTSLALLGLLIVAPAWGQTRVATTPVGRPTNNLSSTIASTGPFQSIAAAATGTTNPSRTACLIQNNGTHTMYVFFGPIANATTGKSVVLPAGNGVSCTADGIVLTDQVSIAGTSGDAFYAGFQ